jgi:hypothetical protein
MSSAESMAAYSIVALPPLHMPPPNLSFAATIAANLELGAPWRPAGAAYLASASLSASRTRPRQSVVRKTSRIATNPRTTDQAAIAIWTPTE